MKENGIISFDIKICFSRRHNLSFSIVSPNGFEYEDKNNIAEKMSIFINYNIAIRPNVPVVLLELEDNIDAGAKLYNHQNTGIYHIPPQNYMLLEKSIKDTSFVVSEEFLKYILETENINNSLTKSFDRLQISRGLNILGFTQ